MIPRKDWWWLTAAATVATTGDATSGSGLLISLSAKMLVTDHRSIQRSPGPPSANNRANYGAGPSRPLLSLALEQLERVNAEENNISMEI